MHTKILSVGVVAAAIAAVLPSVAAAAVATNDKSFKWVSTGSGLAGSDIRDFAYLPDGTALAVGNSGKVSWVPKTGSAQIIGTTDAGLVSIAIAPDYPTSHTIYLANSTITKRTVSVDAAGNPHGIGASTNVLGNAPYTGVATDPDGSLWVSTSDGTSVSYLNGQAPSINAAYAAADVNNPAGKVLHVNADGSGVAKNPFYDSTNPGSTASKVYALGLHHPGKPGINPLSGQPVVENTSSWSAADLPNGDHWDYVDRIHPGNNYGFPCTEGRGPGPSQSSDERCANAAIVDPGERINLFDHTGPSPVTYIGNSYPANYRGLRFSYSNGFIPTTQSDGSSGQSGGPTIYAVSDLTRDYTASFTNIGSPIAMSTNPSNGNISYADSDTGNISELVYTDYTQSSGNTFFFSHATTDPTNHVVSFTAFVASRGGSNPSYHWNFGDETTGDGRTVTHAYAATPASYTVSLSATDSTGDLGTGQSDVYPESNAPTFDFTAPNDGGTYAYGDSITASVSNIVDPDNNTVKVFWSSTLSCTAPADCVNQKIVEQYGKTFSYKMGSFNSDPTITTTALITDGKTTQTRSFSYKPRQHRVTVATNENAEISLGTTGLSSTLLTEGATVSITTPSYSYNRLPLISAAPQSITVPTNDISVEATYGTSIAATYQASASLQQDLGKPLGPVQGDGPTYFQLFEHGRLYQEDNGPVYEVRGWVLNRFLADPSTQLRVWPTSNEVAVGDGKGVYQDFFAEAIYSSPAGAYLLDPSTRSLYRDSGGPTGTFGYPQANPTANVGETDAYQQFQHGIIATHAGEAAFLWGGIYGYWTNMSNSGRLGNVTSGELTRPDGVGKVNWFDKGAIWYSPKTNVHATFGYIQDKYQAFGWETKLGYPTTDIANLANNGLAQHYQSGSIYSSPTTGAHDVRGSIRDKWSSLGWERSWLGYPTSNEFSITNGARSNFQHGYIICNFTTGVTTAYRY